MSGFIDRHRKAVLAWLVLGPTLVGMYFVTGLINPFWGSLSGFPLYLIARSHPVYGPHPPTELLAFLVWPIVVFAGRIYVAIRLLDWGSRWRTPLIIVWALSAFTVVPFYKLPLWFSGWPVWCACE